MATDEHEVALQSATTFLHKVRLFVASAKCLGREPALNHMSHNGSCDRAARAVHGWFHSLMFADQSSLHGYDAVGMFFAQKEVQGLKVRVAAQYSGVVAF